jgi:putative Holliday junction resolvase
VDPSAKVLGLDVGRRWTGLAISDPQLLQAKPLKTVELETTSVGVQGDIMETCRKIRNIIRSKHVKGLVVGYPLDENGEPTRHCQYIQEFLGHLSFDGQLRTPVTLVNEYGSSMEAKALIARRVNTLGLI